MITLKTSFLYFLKLWYWAFKLIKDGYKFNLNTIAIFNLASSNNSDIMFYLYTFVLCVPFFFKLSCVVEQHSDGFKYHTFRNAIISTVVSHSNLIKCATIPVAESPKHLCTLVIHSDNCKATKVILVFNLHQIFCIWSLWRKIWPDLANLVLFSSQFFKCCIKLLELLIFHNSLEFIWFNKSWCGLCCLWIKKVVS